MASPSQEKSVDKILESSDVKFVEDSSQTSTTIEYLMENLTISNELPSSKNSIEKTDNTPNFRSNSSLCNSNKLPNYNSSTHAETGQSWEYLEMIRKPKRTRQRNYQLKTSKKCRKFAFKVEIMYRNSPPQFQTVNTPKNLHSILQTEPLQNKKQLKFKDDIRDIRIYPLQSSTEQNFDPWSFIDVRREDEHLIKDIMDPNNPDRVRRNASQIAYRKYKLQIYDLDRRMKEDMTTKEYKRFKTSLRTEFWEEMKKY